MGRGRVGEERHMDLPHPRALPMCGGCLKAIMLQDWCSRCSGPRQVITTITPGGWLW